MDPYREAAEQAPLEEERPFFPRVDDRVWTTPVRHIDLSIWYAKPEYCSRVGRVIEIFSNGIYQVEFKNGLPRTGLFFITELTERPIL